MKSTALLTQSTGQTHDFRQNAGNEQLCSLAIKAKGVTGTHGRPVLCVAPASRSRSPALRGNALLDALRPQSVTTERLRIAAFTFVGRLTAERSKIAFPRRAWERERVTRVDCG